MKKVCLALATSVMATAATGAWAAAYVVEPPEVSSGSDASGALILLAMVAAVVLMSGREIGVSRDVPDFDPEVNDDDIIIKY